MRAGFPRWLVIGLVVVAGCGGDCKGVGCGDAIVLTMRDEPAASLVSSMELCLDNGREQPCVVLAVPSAGTGGEMLFPPFDVDPTGRLTLTLTDANGDVVSVSSVDAQMSGPQTTCSGDCKVPRLLLSGGVLTFTEE